MARPRNDESTSLPSSLQDVNEGAPIIIVSSFFIPFCTLLVSLRFVVAHRYKRPKGLDDWLAIPALLATLALCTLTICTIIYGGGGRSQPYLMEHDMDTLRKWPKYLLAVQLLYALSIILVKLSVLAFYLRIFSVQKWVRWTVHFLTATIILWGLIGSVVNVFRCKPAESAWNLNVKGTCIDRYTFYAWTAVPPFAHDLVMLLLPIPPTFKLQISLRRKIALSFVFLIGSFGCVASLLRVYYFFDMPDITDFTRDGVRLLPWSVAEPAVILVCACLPSLWPVIRGMPCFGSLTGETVRRTGGGAKGFTAEQESHPGWSVHARIHARTQDDDFIPLYEVEDRAGVPVTGSSYSCEQASRRPSDQNLPKGNVINVKKEFSVQ